MKGNKAESNILRAGIIALVASVGCVLFIALMSGGGVRYKTPMDPKEFYSMSYEEQKSWRAENEIQMTGIEYVKEMLSHPESRWQWFWATAGMFIVIFFSCVTMAWWMKRDSGV